MTVGIGINCSDGIVLACDSLTTFGRGVPVLRYANKVVSTLRRRTAVCG